jgi:hypothetical protein
LKTAWLNLRYSHPERCRLFADGLTRLGYKVSSGLCREPRDNDLMVTWNRIGEADAVASRFRQVLVAENASLGNGFRGRWLHIARTRHNTAGMFPVGGPERWDSMGVDLAPFRDGETVILPQRGIGSPPTAMPLGWTSQAHKRYGGRVRKHPGRMLAKPLAEDLERCGRVVTWGSGAAVLALMLGCRVVSEMPDWIGEQDNTDEGRLAMFRRLAWAQWRETEIASGEAFARLLV